MRSFASLALVQLLMCGATNAQVLPDIQDLGKKRKPLNTISLPDEPGLVYLSTFKPDVIKRFGDQPLVGEHFVRFDNRTRIGGENSLFLLAQEHNGYAAVKFTLGREFSGIVSVYGFILDEPRDGSALRFIVQSDKRVLWTSEPVTPDHPAGRCAVRLNGKKDLELWIRLKGFFEGTEAAWIEPVLVPPDFPLVERVGDLKQQAVALEARDAAVFKQRWLLLSGVADIQGDKKAAYGLQQAEKIALQRLRPK